MWEKEMIKDIKLFLFDMDGTLYLGDRLFDFTKELLETIRQKGAEYLFMTNNSSKSVSAYIEKLDRLGIKAVKEDFITSSQATAYYLKKHHPDARLYVCGTGSLKEELKENGFEITENLAKVDAIVMGFDTELTFKKLEDVCKLLLSRDLPYLATNPDYVCPTGQLAVSDLYCGHHVGDELLDFIKSWDIDPLNKTGCRYVIVDAVNHQKVFEYYQRNGFKFLFSSDEEEWTFLHNKGQASTTPIEPMKTRLMYFDLIYLRTK